MKNYIKPSINYIELRVEESLAGIGSGSSITYITDNKKLIDEQMFSGNWLYFWLSILRK